MAVFISKDAADSVVDVLRSLGYECEYHVRDYVDPNDVGYYIPDGRSPNHIVGIRASRWEKVVYIGEPIKTRGDYGDLIYSGRLDPDGYVHTWDSTFGWTTWGKFNPIDWERTEIIVKRIEDDY